MVCKLPGRGLYMMKHYEIPEAEREMAEKIKTEYRLFRYKTLSGTPRMVYGSCRRICFYESIKEYFLYNEQINRDFINASRGCSKIINELWKIYLKYEYLKADTWDEIENLLQAYVDEHKKCTGKME